MGRLVDGNGLSPVNRISHFHADDGDMFAELSGRGKEKASLPSWSIIVLLPPALSSAFSPVLNNLLSNVDLDLLKEALIKSAPSWRL